MGKTQIFQARKRVVIADIYQGLPLAQILSRDWVNKKLPGQVLHLPVIFENKRIYKNGMTHK